MSQTPLYEIPNARQHAGEPLRRWFYSFEQDLYVWTNDAEQMVAFQLCYGKREGHSALHWHQATGFKHLRVDADGYGTPLMVADTRFDKAAVLASFQTLSAQVPADITAFVRARLAAYPLHTSEADPQMPLQP
jgi:hypothetical protein